jgi:DNA-binding beta-propeller fold protein YncE
MIRPSSLRTLSVIAVLAALALGDRPAAQDKTQKSQKSQKGGKAAAPPRPGQTVWPLPPETPRIRYVTTYRGVADFQQKKESRWKEMLLGADQSTRPAEALIKPYGVAVGPGGQVYVTDTAARRVFVFDAAAKTVTFVGEEGVGKLTKPIGVAVDGDGKVFVADATLNRVFGYMPDGSVAIAIGHEGELENPSGMAVDRTNKLLYVADSKKHKVLCYSTVDGAAVREIGKRGMDNGEFNFPTNLFVDREGRLYVADTLNFRVQIFDSGGKFVRAFGSQGDTAGKLNRPKGVAVDSEGHVYVADTSFNNFQIFDAEANLLLFVGTSGRGTGEFLLPAGMFIDDQDRIYVADQGNARVQVFQYLKGPAK